MVLSTIITLQLLLGAPAELSLERIATPSDIASFKGVSLSVDQAELNAIPKSGSVRIPNFPLGIDRNVNLQLQRFEVLTPDAELVVGSLNRHGELLQRPISRPNIVLLRGQIEGDPSSRVFIALGEHTTNGMIESDGRTYVLAMDQNRERTFVYNINDVDPEDMNWIDFRCGVEDAAIPLSPNRKSTPRNLNSGCIAVQVAIDTDYEFTEDLFDGNVAASSEYAITLVAAVSSIFQTDVNAALVISYLRLWDTSSDPWDADDTSEQLQEFRAYWQEHMTAVPRHLAHLLCGRHLGGGVAWVGQICTSYGYGLSANIHGSFPQPLTDHQSNNWDPFVVAHELGHNFGTWHTHDYSPPIDGCGLGDCTDAYGGTIMSYCHTCSGRMTNIVLSFHELIQETIEDYLLDGVSCSLDCTTDIPGACCIIELCVEATESNCDSAGGIFLGTGTLCATGGCEPLQTGGCCIGDLGTCVESDVLSCITKGGIFLGIDIDCDSDFCVPGSPFACCYLAPDGENLCDDLTEKQCQEENESFWSGLGVFCIDDESCQPPGNDICDSAETIHSGFWEFSTVGAVREGDLPPNDLCLCTYLGNVNHDVWFKYTACESSELIVSTCSLVNFNSDIVVYEGSSCDSMQQVACNGRAVDNNVDCNKINCAGFTSQVVLDVTENTSYLIQVGGFTDTTYGSGQIFLGGQICYPNPPCISDVNGDGVVDITDLLLIIDFWGQANVIYDIDEDGIVGIGDLLFVINQWGPCHK